MHRIPYADGEIFICLQPAAYQRGAICPGYACRRGDARRARERDFVTVIARILRDNQRGNFGVDSRVDKALAERKLVHTADRYPRQIKRNVAVVFLNRIIICDAVALDGAVSSGKVVAD